MRDYPINSIFIILFFLFVFVYKIYNQKKYNHSKYTAVIIEPRQHPALELVLQNFTRNLDTRWSFIIFHGTQNLEYIQTILRGSLSHEAYRIKLINLDVDNLSTDQYNRLLYTPKFYDNIPTETFLVFQTDSIICDKYKNLVYDFIDYDYVGAPWKWDHAVGNGGLSLRKKSKMLQILREHPAEAVGNEDLYFSRYAHSKPGFDKAKEFSIETTENDKSFGIHKAWHFVDNDKVAEFCVDFTRLRDLHKT